MRSWGPAVLSLSLLVLTVITVTRGQTQYSGVLQGLQQLFLSYQGNENVDLFNGATRAPHKQTNRQESKKKTVIRHRIEERLTTQPPPMYQYDYVFTTMGKPSQKPTKSIQNNNSSVKTTTTTEASYFDHDGNNRGTTQDNNSNVTRPVTENVFENVNHRETFAVNNQPRPANVISNESNNNSNNLNQGNTFGGFNYSDTPLIKQPEVQPSPVDVGVPPITNRPASNNNNFEDFNRPSDPSSGTLTDQPDQEPEILIGPNEDDMTESQKKEYAEKAERMCDYYKSFAEKMALSRILSPKPGEIKASICAPINVPLVIGGSVASIREFPHMALVGWKKRMNAGYLWHCGGSLISDRYVLTAAHCTYPNIHPDAVSDSAPPQAVQLGSSYRDDRGALVVKISAVIRHPKYMQRWAYHDIALIKMVSKVKFSEVIRPACLGVPPPTDRSITATGWGLTEFRGDPHVQLRSISINVWDMQECQYLWRKSRRFPNGVLPDSHICAGDRGGWHDTCTGDSGGPVQIQDGCLWRVVAVTSLGKSCGGNDIPALYAVIPHAFVAAQVFDEVSLE